MVAPENLDLVVQVRVLTGQLIHMSDFRAIILAAGRGTRMKSETPKVLHKICGQPVLEYVLDIVRALRSLKTYVVTGHGAGKVREAAGDGFEWVTQEPLLGTGDAVMRCAPHFKNYHGDVLVLCGDTPLLSRAVVAALLKKHRQTKAAATFLTANMDNPRGYGRIVACPGAARSPSVKRKTPLRRKKN